MRSVKGSVDIYSSNAGFYYILKVLGLAPFGFDREKLRLKVTSTNYFQFTASLAFWVYMTWVEHASRGTEQYEVGIQSNLLESIWKYQFTIQHFLAIGLVIFSFIKWKHVDNLLILIHFFDLHLQNLQWEFQPKQNNVWFPVVFFLLSLVVTTSFTLFLTTNGDYGNITNIMQGLRVFNYLLINIFFLIVSMNFILSVSCINQRLVILTENFRWVRWLECSVFTFDDPIPIIPLNLQVLDSCFLRTKLLKHHERKLKTSEVLEYSMTL